MFLISFRRETDLKDCVALSGFLVLVAATLFSCGRGYVQQELPSGKTIKVVAVSNVHFANDVPLLQLQYLTESSIRDATSLRKEAEEIWPLFRTRVEESAFTVAAITAVKPRLAFAGFQTSENYGFVVTRNPNGTWTHVNWGRDYDGEELALATSLLTHLQNAEFAAVAGMLHYPERFSDEERVRDMSAISEDMQLVSEALGVIRGYGLNDSRFVYDSITLITANEEYWQKHPIFDCLAFDVSYEKVGDGYAIIAFSIIDEKIVVHSIRYCLRAQMQGSKQLLTHLLERGKSN